MRNFLKPTKVTWTTLAILLVVIFVPVFLLNGNLSFNTVPDFTIYPFIISYLLLFTFFHAIGLPVGKSGEGFIGFPVPNLFGWTIIVGVQLIFLYTLASLLSLIWYKIKGTKVNKPIN